MTISLLPLFSLLFSSITTATPIETVPQLEEISNLTTPEVQNLTFRTTNCINPLSSMSPRWLPPTSPKSPSASSQPATWDPADCFRVLTTFYTQDVVLKKDLPREFSSNAAILPPSPPSPGKGPLSGIQTPRKYVAGSCTLSIMNMDVVMKKLSFEGLPGAKGSWPWPIGDSETFRKIYDSAGKIAGACVEHSGTPGWFQLGENDALGVFLWGTDSWMDESFPPATDTSKFFAAANSSDTTISSSVVETT